MVGSLVISVFFALMLVVGISSNIIKTTILVKVTRLVAKVFQNILQISTTKEEHARHELPQQKLHVVLGGKIRQ
jgi:hypothetical protein